MFRKCNRLTINNYYTGNNQCKSDFSKQLLYTSIQNESMYRQNCWGCGFLWLSTCCEDVYIGQGQRQVNLYGCSRNASANVQSNVVFGGFYTAQKVNPVTNDFTCPVGLSTINDLDGIRVCLAERISPGSDTLPRYGGIYSCQYGNLVTASLDKGCTDGYSPYVMGPIDGNCLLQICLKFEQSDSMRELPSIALPPFFEIDTIYSVSDTNTTTTNATTAARTFSGRYLINARASRASKFNQAKLSFISAAVGITITYHRASLI